MNSSLLRVQIFYLILIFSILMSGIAYSAPKDVIIGIKDGGNAIPWWGTMYDEFSFQALYMQSDIAMEGMVVAFAWMNSMDSGEHIFNNVRIYMGHTTQSHLGSTFMDNYSEPPVLVVNETPFYTGGLKNTWNEINLSTPFSYNNKDNLIIEVRWKGDDGGMVPLFVGTMTDHGDRLYAPSESAETGTAENNMVYYLKLRIDDSMVATPTPAATATPYPVPVSDHIMLLYFLISIVILFLVFMNESRDQISC